MKSYERKIFCSIPAYKSKLITRIIAIIRYGNRNSKTVENYKLFLFKMMRAVVERNYNNFEKLMSTLPYDPTTLSRNEIITESYILLDTCLKKFKPSSTNNFYFFYNKSLMRYFYRMFQKKKAHPHVTMTDELMAVHHKKQHEEPSPFSDMSILYSTFHLTEIEIRVLESRVKSESMVKFLKANKDINDAAYRDALESMRQKVGEHIHELKEVKEK